jgi:hypothetical protein
VEVIVFPRDYEKYSSLLIEENKVFVLGRVSVEEDKDGKILCEHIVAFEDAGDRKTLFGKQSGYNFNQGFGSGQGDHSNQYAPSGGRPGSVKSQDIVVPSSGQSPSRSVNQDADGRPPSRSESQDAGGRPPSRSESQDADGRPPSRSESQGMGQQAGNGVTVLPQGVWIQFPSKEDYEQAKSKLYSAISDSRGRDSVVIYIKESKSIKILPYEYNVRADKGLRERLFDLFGETNVKFRINSIDNQGKMD